MKLTPAQTKALEALKIGATLKPRFRKLDPRLYGRDAEGALIEHHTGDFFELPGGDVWRLNENVHMGPVWAALAPAVRIVWEVSASRADEAGKLQSRHFGHFIASDYTTFLARLEELHAKHPTYKFRVFGKLDNGSVVRFEVARKAKV